MKTHLKPQNNSFQLFKKYIGPQKLTFLILSLCILGGIGIQLVNPQIIRAFIDAALQPEANQSLLLMAALFFGFAIFQQLLAIGTTYLAQTIGWKATNALRDDILKHCLKLDLDYYKSIRQGEIIEIIEGDVNTLFNFFSKLAIVLVTNVLLLTGVLALYFREDYRIGLAQMFFVVISFFVISKIKKLGNPYWDATRKKSGELFGYYGEIIQNTEDLKANGAVDHVVSVTQKHLSQWLPIRVKAGVSGWAMFMTTLFLQLISFGLSLGIGTWLWQQGSVSVGTIYLFYAYSTHLNRPIDAIQRQIQELQTVSISMKHITDVLNRKSRIIDPPKGKLVPKGCSLHFNKVGFGYIENEPVIDALSFSLKPGTSLGIIGRTGSGKTTLARLLMRFYDTDSGEIQLNSTSIKDFSLTALRQKVAYVTQEVQLFNGTIRDNLTFFDPSISDDTLLQAISEMGISDWFSTFEKGLDTVLSSGGGGLSAGESQLLAFVRIFLNDPEIIILDEVSSRLDPETERQVQKSIQKLLAGRIGIIIAHKLWTLDHVDQIMILEKGHLVEYGNRKALLNDNASRFKQLMTIGIEEVIA